jgi:hypothetical protein
MCSVKLTPEELAVAVRKLMDYAPSREAELKIISDAIRWAEERGRLMGAMTPSQRLKRERDEKILTTYKLGVPLKDMAETYQLTENSIRQVLIKMGVARPKFKRRAEMFGPPRPRGHVRKMMNFLSIPKDEKRVADVRRAIGEGQTMTEVAHLFGVTKQAISSLCHCHHIPVPKRGRRKQ